MQSNRLGWSLSLVLWGCSDPVGEAAIRYQRVAERSAPAADHGPEEAERAAPAAVDRATLAARRARARRLDRRDAETTTQLKFDLLIDTDFDFAGQIDVRVRRGVATLDGTVPGVEAYQRALQVASTTRGVRRVIDRLQIADAEIPAPPVMYAEIGGSPGVAMRAPREPLLWQMHAASGILP